MLSQMLRSGIFSRCHSAVNFLLFVLFCHFLESSISIQVFVSDSSVVQPNCGGVVAMKDDDISYERRPICADESWSMEDADVICRQLTFGPALAAETAPLNGEKVWISTLTCTGIEDDLNGCFFRFTTSCPSDRKAVVRCSCRKETDGTMESARLVGGGAPCQGRLEVFINGVWGAVCDDRFGRSEAEMACKAVGYSDYVTYSYLRAPFGAGTRDFVADDVNCPRDSESLSACEFVSDDNCDGDEVLALVCSGCDDPPSNGENEVRLTGGITNCEGNVEVFSKGSWGFVCANGFDEQDALVACRSAGYSGLSSIPPLLYGEDPTNSWFDGPFEYLMDNLACTGDEQSLADCPHSLALACSYGPARVSCSGSEECDGNYANFYFPTFGYPTIIAPVLFFGVCVFCIVRKKRMAQRRR